MKETQLGCVTRTGLSPIHFSRGNQIMVTSMLKRAVGVAKDAAENSSTNDVKNKQDVKKRRLVPVLQKGQKLFVVTSARENDFQLPPKQQATAALISLFQGTKKAPGPLVLFNGTTNIVDLVPQRDRKRSSDYIDGKGVESYVVAFHLCTDLGQPKQSEQIAALERSGFTLLPLQQHPEAKLIRQALHLD